MQKTLTLPCFTALHDLQHFGSITELVKWIKCWKAHHPLFKTWLIRLELFHPLLGRVMWPRSQDTGTVLVTKNWVAELCHSAISEKITINAVFNTRKTSYPVIVEQLSWTVFSLPTFYTKMSQATWSSKLNLLEACRDVPHDLFLYSTETKQRVLLAKGYRCVDLFDIAEAGKAVSF